MLVGPGISLNIVARWVPSLFAAIARIRIGTCLKVNEATGHLDWANCLCEESERELWRLLRVDRFLRTAGIE